MRITSKGQVTIPLAIRQATVLLPDCGVEFEVKGKKVLMRKAAAKRRAHCSTSVWPWKRQNEHSGFKTLAGRNSWW